jgi:hypothetical protein
MSKAYNCLPSELWPNYDPRTPKGFYFNRGVFYFGRKVENEMEAAKASARKAHKSGGADAAERMANGAALRVLEKHLGAPIKRNRDPGRPTKMPSKFPGGTITDKEDGKDESVIIKVD